MLLPSIVPTEDESKTLFSPQFKEHYHSTFGALGESRHIYLDAAYHFCAAAQPAVLEVGFGTGLNAYLTRLEAEKTSRKTYYEALELYPLPREIYLQLSDEPRFLDLHNAEWEKENVLSETFSLKKRNLNLEAADYNKLFDIVYFDAFSPNVQPELWTQEIFQKIYDKMNTNAVLTTYCAKGEVRRTLQRIGFIVERIPGPKGKREIIRAVKE